MEELPGEEMRLQQTEAAALLQHDPLQSEKHKAGKPEVVVIRNWKEYLGESLL